jgi:hypothetical protein
MSTGNGEFTNWVDLDILAENEDRNIGYDQKSEQGFKDFFEVGWLDSKYDYLRDRWDHLINDNDPRGRLMGKVALWNLARLLNIQAGTPFDVDRRD